MPTRKVRAVEGILDIGGIEIPSALLTTLEGGEPSRKGITVLSERASALLLHADGSPVEYSITVMVTREPVDAREKAAVEVYISGVDSRKAEKEAKEEKTLRNEKRAMFELGQQAGSAVFDKLGAIAPALDAIEKLGMNLRAK